MSPHWQLQWYHGKRESQSPAHFKSISAIKCIFYSFIPHSNATPNDQVVSLRRHRHNGAIPRQLIQHHKAAAVKLISAVIQGWALT